LLPGTNARALHGRQIPELTFEPKPYNQPFLITYTQEKWQIFQESFPGGCSIS
jgi:hypothetical protein